MGRKAGTAAPDRAGGGKLYLQMVEMGNEPNLVTIEDPVDYRISGAVRPTGTREHFAKTLTDFCRVYPAFRMVSKIRAAATAREVLQFIDTGAGAAP